MISALTTGFHQTVNDHELFCYDAANEDTIAAVMYDISYALHPQSFVSRLNEYHAFGQYAMAVGATSIDDEYINTKTMNDGWTPDNSSKLHYSILHHDDLEYAISALSASSPTGITASRLADVFRISEKIATDTLKVTTQRLCRSADPTLCRNFPTNDRML